jgi:hypothetical protein
MQMERRGYSVYQLRDSNVVNCNRRLSAGLYAQEYSSRPSRACKVHCAVQCSEERWRRSRRGSSGVMHALSLRVSTTTNWSSIRRIRQIQIQTYAKPAALFYQLRSNLLTRLSMDGRSSGFIDQHSCAISQSSSDIACPAQSSSVGRLGRFPLSTRNGIAISFLQ